MNTVALMGRIGNDLEVKQTQSGTDVLRFSLAVRNPFNRGGNNTDWFHCVAFNKQAQFMAQYFHKGEMVAITGRLQPSVYEDKHGERRESVNVIVNSSDFCSSKGDKKYAEPHGTAQSQTQDNPLMDDSDDLPF